MKKIQVEKPKFTKKRNFKYGTVATAITVGFVALVVVINVIATLLLNKYPLTVDLTSSGKYDVSQESIGFVQEIDRPIEIYVLADESYFTDPAAGVYQAGDLYQIGEMMRKYTQYNDKITLNYIDLENNPGFAAKYPQETFAAGDMIIQSELRYQKLSYNDMFNVTYNSNYTAISSVSSKAEEVLTSALLYVTDKEPVQVAITGGHQEADMTALNELLNKNGFETSTVETLGAEIDSSAQILVIAGPTVDFTDEEIKKVDDFLTNGGAYGKQVVYLANPQQKALPNLETYLAEWGIGFEDGFAYETDSNKIFRLPLYTLQDPDAINLEFIGRTEALNATMAVPYVRPVKALFEAQNLRSTKVISKTFDTTVLYSTDGTLANDKAQSYATIVAGMKDTDTTVKADVKTSTIVAVGTTEMFASDYLNSASLGNGQFTVSMFNTLAQKESPISVLPKELTAATFDISATTSIVLSIVFVALLPLAVLVIGLVVFLRRRNL